MALLSERERERALRADVCDGHYSDPRETATEATTETSTKGSDRDNARDRQKVVDRLTDMHAHTHTHRPVSYTHLTLPTICSV
eukprot:12974234-Alexandrium_andersonii.AAC.1